ncbi:hypothetical protein NON00_12885 [Roseomonas sp. GC11]|uniref:hypothetical protein n=1 Tax=Roseomonas sp. GC11 TaxID=2950546 RepID=UPI00210A705A|nr:hypothetical protein [Roseomonas sp. GC11]MCQ4160823.1 hypothetical protein [Roseomonas sp. GC11]
MSSTAIETTRGEYERFYWLHRNARDEAGQLASDEMRQGARVPSERWIRVDEAARAFHRQMDVAKAALDALEAVARAEEPVAELEAPRQRPRTEPGAEGRAKMTEADQSSDTLRVTAHALSNFNRTFMERREQQGVRRG